MSTALTSLLGNDFVNGADLASIVGDAPLVGIYFSAHWCGPCRGYTPKLKEFYDTLVAQGTPLPILFASSDQDEDSFASYFAEMPWHAFKFGDDRIEVLNVKYEVSGIPWLVILNAKTGAQGTPLPILFASSDQDEDSFASYFAEMPWHAFQFGDDRIKVLKKKYEVSGIPWLVILNAKTGELVMNEADAMVGEDSAAIAKWCDIAAAQ
eukprot:CAMPEP_0194394344 /NCGR_PEP_ID=MMETSP0174-20130528/123806_1 /TAXON_ID=216777 /ORGANISM="Proboscia alata, Strain PI-D3" /LENGTH=208 /DNA_ID=CAMNT_0039190135 /DNA_START=766 /DNA_END=1393 /DNA_ORIENTATION=+